MMGEGQGNADIANQKEKVRHDFVGREERRVNMRIARKIKNALTPHYLIIGHYTGASIGCTCGKRGKEDVLCEEPLSTFKRISKRRCPICNKT